MPRLREWRERRGLTQQELADAVGVARDSVSKWETGGRGAYPSTARKLAAALYIPVDELTVYPKVPLGGADLRRRVAALRDSPDKDQVMVFRYRMMLLGRELQPELQRGREALQAALAREENEAAWGLVQDAPNLSGSVCAEAQQYEAAVAHIRQTLCALEELEADLEERQAAWYEQAAS